MNEIDTEPWLRPVHRHLDAETLTSPIEEVHTIVVAQLTRMRTAWHDTRSHVYTGVDSLFEGEEFAEETIDSQRTSGTYFNISCIPALKILAGDDYIVFTHINTTRPFYRWNAPERWDKPNCLLTLGDAYDALRPVPVPNEEPHVSGWAKGMQEPDLLIGITRTPNGRYNWDFPLEVEMDNYTSKGVRPGTGDTFHEGHLKQTKSKIFDVEGLRLAAMSINNIVTNSDKS